MTFLEAAIELLKREGKPLSSQRLAQLAVERRLLSVVGRDPEGMMEERLTDFIDKHPHDGDLFRLRPGLYGLRNYPGRLVADLEPSAPSEEAAPTTETS